MHAESGRSWTAGKVGRGFVCLCVLPSFCVLSASQLDVSLGPQVSALGPVGVKCPDS
jgi:hypothetical protein